MKIISIFFCSDQAYMAVNKNCSVLINCGVSESSFMFITMSLRCISVLCYCCSCIILFYRCCHVRNVCLIGCICWYMGGIELLLSNCTICFLMFSLSIGGILLFLCTLVSESLFDKKVKFWVVFNDFFM